MPPAEALEQALAFLAQRRHEVTLALATFDTDAEAPTYRQLNISGRVADDFLGVAGDFADGIAVLRAAGDLVVREFSAGFKPDPHEIEYLSWPDDPLRSIMERVPSPARIPLIGDVEDFVERMRFYALILSGGNRRAVLFRRYGRSRELRRSGNPIIRLVGERYDRLTEPVFQFDRHFDAILFGEYVFVLRKADFQHVFRYYERLKATAAEALGVLAAAVPIENLDAFQESCLSHLQKLEKLRNISRKHYLERLSMQALKETIAEFRVDVDVVVVDGEERLLFDPKKRWAILNLLDDAYLGSRLTGAKYEANSKRELEGG